MQTKRSILGGNLTKHCVLFLGLGKKKKNAPDDYQARRNLGPQQNWTVGLCPTNKR